MYEILDESPNLRLTAAYLGAIEDVFDNPADDTAAERLRELDGSFGEQFGQHIRNPWNVDEGYEPSGYASSILSLREKAVAEPEFYNDQYASDCRAALIFVGTSIATSSALDQSEYPLAYQMILGTLDHMKPGDDNFKAFWHKRTSEFLYEQFIWSRNGHNFTPLSPEQMESNIRQALKLVGYPKRALGRYAVAFSRIMPRSASRMRSRSAEEQLFNE